VLYDCIMEGIFKCKTWHNSSAIKSVCRVFIAFSKHISLAMSAFPRTRGIIFSELPLATQTQVDFEMLLLLVSSFFVDFL